jgi:hypothetical protein
MKRFLLLALVLTACTDKREAIRVLEMEDVTNVEFTGYDWLACGQGEIYHTGFIGKRNGKHVMGTVCSSLFFKKSTVRY